MDINKSVTKITGGGSLKIQYKVGPFHKRFVVCKARYAELFRRGETFIDDVIKEVKDNVQSTQPPFNDQTRVSPKTLKDLKA